MTYIEPCLMRKKEKSVVEKIALIILLCLACQAMYLIVDLFIVREPLHAQEPVIVEDYEGQTIELCKKKLANNN